MTTAKFRCKRCKRSFSMAAHLARHNSTKHGLKKKSSTAGSSKRKRAVHSKVVRTSASSRASMGSISSVSGVITSSQRVIRAMQDHYDGLLAQRSSLDAQIDAFAAAMRTIGASTSTETRKTTGKKRGRPAGSAGRRGSLKSYIDRVLRQTSKPMSRQEIGVRVIKAGFKTRSKDLTKAVGNTLTSLKNVQRVGYGKYQMTG